MAVWRSLRQWLSRSPWSRGRGGTADTYARRAEAEPDPVRRLALLDAGVAALSRASGPAVEALRRRRAELVFDLVQRGVLQYAPSEMRALARELEARGSLCEAARAYAHGGDVDGQARVLAELGAIDELEQALDAHREGERRVERRERLERELDDLVRTGGRRRALALAGRLRDDGEAFERVFRTLDAARVRAPWVRLSVDGQPAIDVVLGDVVSVGRSGATVVVPSPSLSRVHLELRRRNGRPVVVDAGSRNGTTLRGARIDGPLEVGEGLALVLGGDVPLGVAPHGASAVLLEVGARRVVVPLDGFDAGGFVLRPADDWVELVSPSGRAVLGDLEVATPIELLRGDEIRAEAGGPVRLRVEQPS